jgi:hypothetical protein
LAAALFGGISGAPPPPPQPASYRPSAITSPQLPLTVSGPIKPDVRSAPAPAPVSPPPEVDLLGFDMDTSTTTVSHTSSVDMFAPMPMVDESSHAPPVTAPAPKPAAPPPAPADPCKLLSLESYVDSFGLVHTHNCLGHTLHSRCCWPIRWVC